jgi:hypothetical protein
MNYPRCPDDYSLTKYQEKSVPAAIGQELGKISNACKLRGYRGNTFYEVRVSNVATFLDEERGLAPSSSAP